MGIEPIYQHSFCTLTQDDRDGSGQGDSGGPIVVNVGSTEDPEYALAGVVAYGRPRVYYPSGGHNYNAHLTGSPRASDFKRFILSHFPNAPFNSKTACNRQNINEGPSERWQAHEKCCAKADWSETATVSKVDDCCAL